jgi:hypothetical protein
MDFTTVNATNATGSFSAGATLLAVLVSDVDIETATLTKGTIAGPFDMTWDDGSGMPPLSKKIDALKKSLR